MVASNLNSVILSDHPLSLEWIKRGAALLETRGTTTTISLRNPSWRDELLSALIDADILLVSPWSLPDITLDHALLDRASRLRAIGVTYDNRFSSFVSVDALTERGIVLIETSRSMSPSIAEFAVAQTLNLLRDIPTAIALMRAGGWKESEIDPLAYIHGDLAGKKVGLAGYGAINRRYHQLISGFGCQVASYDPMLDPSRAEQHGLTYTASLEELAAASEIFVVGIPPLKSSLRAIGKSVFDALPIGGLFVLVSRMAVVDEPALWDAVNNRGLRAAIDVFGAEPAPSDAPFRFYPNVLPTPHIAGAPFYQHERCFYDACVDCLAAIEGQPRRFEAMRRDESMYRGLDGSTPKPRKAAASVSLV